MKIAARILALLFVLSPFAPRAVIAYPQAGREADRLSEPREARANRVQPPGQVMELIGIEPGLVVGEVGAGRGRITVHVADRVGRQGRVYANDIDAEALAHLKTRCQRLELSNVETVEGLPNDARLPAGRLDLVFMTWVYHHVDDRVALLASLLPSLKPGGFVALVEPTPETTEPGLRPLTRDSVADEARRAGFRLEKTIEGRLERDNVFILRPSI